MDFSKQIDELEEHVADIKSSAQAAATESREKLEQRIDKAQADLNTATQTAKQEADTAASGARGKWAQMKTDVAAKVGQTRAKMDKQAARMDADAAAADADWAEADADEAIDFAVWAVDNARVSVLSAIATRAEADQLTSATR